MNQRKVVERVFGNIKWNLGFKRFSRKGFQGASIEIMIIVLTLNLKKMGKLILFIFRNLMLKYQQNNYLSLQVL